MPLDNAERKKKMIERFDDARAFSIVTLLEEVGCAFKGGGTKIRSAYCPHCGGGEDNPPLIVDTDKNGYTCFKCGTNPPGKVKKIYNGIDLMISMYDLTPAEAANRILGDVEESEDERSKRIAAANKIREESARKARILLSARRTFLSRVLSAAMQHAKPSDVAANNIKYLTDERAIPVDMIRRALQRKRLAFLPDDINERYKLLRSCLDPEIEAQGEIDKKLLGCLAHRPILFPYVGDDGFVFSMEFRSAGKPEFGPKSMRICSTEIPWIWGQDGKGLLINEGVLDGLSAVAMGFQGTVISLPGITQWQDDWNNMLKDQRVVILFDNDPKPMTNKEGELILDENDDPIYPGKNAAKNLRDQLLMSGLPLSVDARMMAAEGSDINDALIKKKQEDTRQAA